MRRRKSKKEKQQQHARRRFWERYGVRLTRDLKEEIIEKIRSGEAEFLERQSHRVSIFLIELQEEQIPVVYDKNTKELVSALPRAYRSYEWLKLEMLQ